MSDVSAYERNFEAIARMSAALQLCLECGDGLSWEAEQEAQAILKRLDQE